MIGTSACTYAVASRLWPVLMGLRKQVILRDNFHTAKVEYIHVYPPFTNVMTHEQQRCSY
eukprot:3198131-Amphidinium_carterae.1